MARSWVTAGECGKETSIEVLMPSPARVQFEIVTTCERIQVLVDELGEIDIGHEMSCPLTETKVYQIAQAHVCRNSCIVPAALLKSIEANVGIFLPVDCSIGFLEGSI